jgi:hypothetical protein
MKKLLLMALAVSGLAFVSGEHADAQITAGLPGVGGTQFWISGPTVMPTRSATIIIHRRYYRRPYYSYSQPVFVLSQWHPVFLV